MTYDSGYQIHLLINEGGDSTGMGGGSGSHIMGSLHYVIVSPDNNVE